MAIHSGIASSVARVEGVCMGKGKSYNHVRRRARAANAMPSKILGS